MAQFLRIGSMIVNMENITHIEETSEFIQEGVAIAFVGGDDRLFVTDEQHCAQLRAFMNAQPPLGHVEDSVAGVRAAFAHIGESNDDIGGYEEPDDEIVVAERERSEYMSAEMYRELGK